MYINSEKNNEKGHCFVDLVNRGGFQNVTPAVNAGPLYSV